MTQVPIAVVGVSALFPGSTDAHSGFWRDILAGRDLITDVPADALADRGLLRPRSLGKPDKTYAKRGAFLPEVPSTPWSSVSRRASSPPRTPRSSSPDRRPARPRRRHAGQFAEARSRAHLSVILGVTSGQELLGSMVSRLQRPVWLKALRDAGIPEVEAKSSASASPPTTCPGRSRPSPACSATSSPGASPTASTSAAPTASPTRPARAPSPRSPWRINELVPRPVRPGDHRRRRHHERHLHVHVLQQDARALKTGDCRRSRQGRRHAARRGHGDGRAQAPRGRRARRRSGLRRDPRRRRSSDGRSKSVYAPVPEGQARRCAARTRVAGYGPDTVELVEAHGTGTKAGDAAEFEGLNRLRRERPPPTASGARSAR
jgi:hypothetical protein